MAKTRTTKQLPVPKLLKYKSATCDLASAAGQANRLDDEGYDIINSIAVIAHLPPKEGEENGKPIQAIYLLAKRREE